jgi:hypothetical protein
MDAEDLDAQAELARLRARVGELEAQLADVEGWANQAVAQAQAKTYWLDRWHVDLNAVMRRPGASRIRAVGRAVRSFYNAVRKLWPWGRR